MRTNFPPPVFRVRRIGLAAMKNSMPERPFWRVQLLANAVRLVETIEPQPQARCAGAGHIHVADGHRGECGGNVQAA